MDLLEEAIKVGKDEKYREDLIKLVEQTKNDVLPAISVFVELFGDDLDNALNAIQDFVAVKTYRAYQAYIQAGFDLEQAFILTANAKIDIGDKIGKINFNK